MDISNKRFCIFISFILTVLTSFGVAGQSHSRIKINLIGRDLLDLAKAGLEVDHGVLEKNRSFTSDFSMAEIELIKNLDFQYEIIIDDVEALYAAPNRPSELKNNTSSRSTQCLGFIPNEYNYKRPEQYRDGSMGGYFTYQEMIDILDSMAIKYPELITVRTNIDTTKTLMGNSIFYVKLSDHPQENESGEPNILYTALHHAREPNSLSQMIYFLWYALENYGTDPIITKIINETQMYFVPCVNPDGYQANQSTHPNGGGLWRKNLWRNQSGELKGVDLNRNYGHSWGYDDIGSSNNENSQTYRGQSAFSEPETRSIRQLCTNVDFAMALNYHTFGNFLIHPWGFSDQPTDKDSLFKAIGYVMNAENQFVMGTGTETVGYVTNGDSDDWMYGAQDEKNAIYSFTPEVGPSFWPPNVDIDYLNRSCIWMNMSAALLSLNYYDAKEAVKRPFLSPDNNEISIKVTKAGLKDGSCIVQLNALSPDARVINPIRTVSISTGESLLQNFEIEIEPAFEGNEIEFELIVYNDGIITKSKVSKRWISEVLRDVVKDDFSTSTGIDPAFWGLTDEDFYSGPTSLTDSPNGLYNNNIKTIVNFNQPVDLSGMTEAYLTFYAKWAIETSYDYLQVQASSDKLDFIPLCGIYTKSGSTNQEYNSPVYDGKQGTWVEEYLSLNDFLGKTKVWFRLVLKSDQEVQDDGFYIDNWRIVGHGKTISVADESSDPMIFPTIMDQNQLITIMTDNINGSQYFEIIDVVGQVVISSTIDHHQRSVSTSGLKSGIYFYRLSSDKKIIQNGKLVIK